jgi:TolA-binding protein
MKKQKNTETLRGAAKARERKTLEKVDQAIKKLKRSKKGAINFHSVAVAAGVARTTLYRNPVLRERVLINRELEKGELTKEDISPSKRKLEQKNRKIQDLYAEIKALKTKIEDLRVQLIDMEELKKENKRFKSLLKEKTSPISKGRPAKNRTFAETTKGS